MASAKFLEEALATDVDESAVNALVGSLETQLVSATPGQQTTINQNHVNNVSHNSSGTTKFGVVNGSTITHANSPMMLSAETNKQMGAPTSLIGTGIIHSQTTSVNSMVNLQGSLPIHTAPMTANSTVYLSQAGVSQNTIPTHHVAPVVSHSQTAVLQQALTKPNNKMTEIKYVYPTSNTIQTVIGSNPGSPANNNRTGNINQVSSAMGLGLPNGNLGISNLQQLQPMQASSASVSQLQGVLSPSVVQQAGVNKFNIGGRVIGLQEGLKQSIVIKTNNPQQQSVPVSVNANIITSTGVQTFVNSSMVSTTAGNTCPVTATVVTLRPQTTGTAQTAPTHTIIPAGPLQIVNMNAVRPSVPGQAGAKTLAPRVVLGPPQMVRPGHPGAQITLQALQQLQPGAPGHLLLKTENGQYQIIRVSPAPPTTSSLPNVTSPYRIQTVQTQPGGVAMTTPSASPIVHQQVQQIQQSQLIQPSTQASCVTTTAPPATDDAQNAAAQMPPETAKIKCKKFLSNLLELSGKQPENVAKSVRTLIQGLIDGKVDSDDFCVKLQKLLNSNPQPCLAVFLKKSLPHLRLSLAKKELSIDGIKAPSLSVVTQSLNSVTSIVTPIQTASPIRTPMTMAAMTGGQAMRLMTPTTTTGLTLGPVPRPTNFIQQNRFTNTVLNQRPQTIMKGSPLMINTHSPMRSPFPITTTSSVVGMKGIPLSSLSKAPFRDKKTTAASVASSGYSGDDDINDVAAMGGVNLAEETQRILGSTEFVGTQIRSCKDEMLLTPVALQAKVREIVKRHCLEEPSSEMLSLISHATQERIKGLLSKLAMIAEHRMDVIKLDNRYAVSQDVRGQLKFLEELDKLERKRHEEQEREMLMRAAKSRSKSEDPEQAKLKAKAKEMQRAELEEMRQREANLTALQAIGPRKKPRLDMQGSPGASSSQQGSSQGSASAASTSRVQMPLRPRVKRVGMRDLLFLLEQEKDMCRSSTLYKGYLK